MAKKVADPHKVKKDFNLIKKLQNASYISSMPPHPVIGRQLPTRDGNTDGIYHTIEFHFKDSVDAHNFKLPKLINGEYFLNDRILRKSYNKNSVLSYYRLAQIK